MSSSQVSSLNSTPTIITKLCNSSELLEYGVRGVEGVAGRALGVVGEPV